MDIESSRRSAANGDSLCEDILLQILACLPFKSLHKFKLVSKQWFSLITHQVHPKFLGFYFHHSISILLKRRPCVVSLPNLLFRSIHGHDDEITDTSIDTSLSFLPSPDFWILDHCDGLVLCFETRQVILYVCNTATKSWDSVPVPDDFSNTRLAFDPLISRHYKLISTSACEKDRRSSCLEISTYSSEEVGIWKEARLFDLESCFNCLDVGYSAFYNGALFVAFFGMSGSGCIVRVDLLGQGCRLIDFPEHARRPVRRAVVIGKMVDEFCYGELHGQQLRIWALGGEHQDSWVMGHEKTLNVLEERSRACERNQILAFHPFTEAVYILIRGRVFAYDFNSMSLEEVCTLENSGA